jgi:hypothetical protein
MQTRSRNPAWKWALVGAVAIAARLVGYWANPTGAEREMRAYDAFRHVPTDVVTFGDSVMEHVDARDVDRRPLSAEILDGLPGCVTANLAHSSYHPEIFEAVGRFVTRHARTRPRMLIVPVNLRSFSSTWVWHPLYRFGELQRLLLHDSLFYNLAHRPLLVLRWYDGVEGNQTDFDRAPIYDGDRLLGPQGPLARKVFFGAGTVSRDERLRTAFVMRYAARLRADDPRVMALRRLAQVMQERQVSALFYLTPVDWQEAQRVAGPDIVGHIESNAHFLTRVLDDTGATVKDWARLLEHDAFSWDELPNEHLKETGRRDLAGRVVAAARDLAQAQHACGRPRAAQQAE